LLVSSLKIVVSQRLARKLCPHCKVSYVPEESIQSKILGRVGRYLGNKDDIKLYRANPHGCEKCNHKGYK
jgi:type IV pilus assembly protein PilB